jgi:hypothetical protein
MDGSDDTVYISVYRNSEKKKLLLFPQWTLADELISTYSYSTDSGATRAIGSIEIPAKAESTYLFPGRVAISNSDSFGSTKYLMDVSVYRGIRDISSTTTIEVGSEDKLRKLVLETLENCNNSTEDYSDYCPTVAYSVKQTKFRYPRDLVISNIERSSSGSEIKYYFNLGFTAGYEETSYFDGGVSKTPNKVFTEIRAFINLSESPQRIRFN